MAIPKPLAGEVGFHGTIPKDVYRRARVLAIRDGQFVKAWIAQAVAEKVEREDTKTTRPQWVHLATKK